MKNLRSLLLVLTATVLCLSMTSCDERDYIDEFDCVGAWSIAFNPDAWGNYDDGGIMVLGYNGYYEYYFNEYDYYYDRVGYGGRWWIEGRNLLYTYGNDTYSYRITYQSYYTMRLRNNYPPGDTEVWTKL